MRMSMKKKRVARGINNSQEIVQVLNLQKTYYLKQKQKADDEE